MDPAALSSVIHLSDEALVARVKHLAARERDATGALIAHLAELDERRLYLAEGCASLFTYCTQPSPRPPRVPRSSFPWL